MTTLGNILIGIVMFSALFMGMFAIYGDMINWYPDYYNETAQTYYGDVYQQINASFDLASETSDKLRNQTSTEVTALDSAVLGATSVFRLLWNSYNFVNGMIQNVAKELGIPGWIVKTFMTIFLIVIAFAIIDAYFRRNV